MANYYSVNIKITPFLKDAADLLTAFLADEGFEAFEENEEGIKAYIQEESFNKECIQEIIAAFPIPVEMIWTSEFIEQKDWNEEWEKKYFKPLLLGGGRCVVHSTFHTDYPEAEIDITVDPKMAFGTGHHATTSMMVNHLLSMDLKGKSLIDMGTGTGILAIIAKKVGAKDVTGIEIDPGAYENARENVRLNGEADINLLLGDASLLTDLSPVDFFLANINRNIIMADIDRYAKALKPGGKMILSGFYKQDIPLINISLNENKLEIESTEEAGEGWSSIVAIKKS